MQHKLTHVLVVNCDICQTTISDKATCQGLKKFMDNSMEQFQKKLFVIYVIRIFRVNFI